VWVRAENATGTTRVSLRYYDAARQHIRQDDSVPLAEGTADWTPLSLTTVVPPTASYLRIILLSDGNSGRVWFDDVSLDRG
jgi:hypothetical protein